MNEELKPCPFCGGKAVIYVNDGETDKDVKGDRVYD